MQTDSAPTLTYVAKKMLRLRLTPMMKKRSHLVHIDGSYSSRAGLADRKCQASSSHRPKFSIIARYITVQKLPNFIIDIIEGPICPSFSAP